MAKRNKPAEAPSITELLSEIERIQSENETRDQSGVTRVDLEDELGWSRTKAQQFLSKATRQGLLKARNGKRPDIVGQMRCTVIYELA